MRGPAAACRSSERAGTPHWRSPSTKSWLWLTAEVNQEVFCVVYWTLLHLPPLRSHCVGGCWGSSPGLLRLWHWPTDALNTRLDLTHSDRSHPQHTAVVYYSRYQETQQSFSFILPSGSMINGNLYYNGQSGKSGLEIKRKFEKRWFSIFRTGHFLRKMVSPLERLGTKSSVSVERNSKTMWNGSDYYINTTLPVSSFT